ncbi:MAG: hypothetical protein HY908_35330 [Myxococcales bacterium]|nr:hypothetical protein [Myxococcales bacterium]
MKLASVTEATARAAERWVGSARRATTGLRVERPSEDPVTFGIVARESQDIERLDRRARTLERAGGDLDAAEGALADASDLMVRARELALQMADGSMSASERAGAAEEVAGLRLGMLGLANARGARGYLFGGSATATPPFDSGGAFVGNDKALGVEVADDVVVRANPSGRLAFTALGGGHDVLQYLADLAAALAADDQAGVASAVGALEEGHDQLVSARAEVGQRAARLRSAGAVSTGVARQVERARAALAEIDPATAYSDLVATEQAYQRSLEVTRRILAQSAELFK